MTDEQQEPQLVDAAVAAEADDTGATVVGAIGDETGTAAAGAVVTDYDYAVVVAAFADGDAAQAAYGALQDAESAGSIGVEGVLVVKTDENGKLKVQDMTDHSTKTGLKWGVVGGVVLGIIFPPTILASAVGWGVVGGVLGKIRNVAHKSTLSDALAGALGPDESGIVALVKAGDLEAAKATMPAATKVRTAGVDEATAQKVTEAAKQASWPFGLLFRIPIGGLVVGGVMGALFGKMNDLGIKDEYVSKVRDLLKPGTAALVMTYRKATPDKTLDALAPYGGTVLRSSLSKEAEQAIDEALKSGTGS